MNKTCIKCSVPKHISHFGVNSRAADGKNSTCKLCIRIRGLTRDRAGERAALKERKVAEMRVGASPESRILAALEGGPLGWDELERTSKAGDELSEILLMLMDEGAVRMRRVGEGRVYSKNG